MFKEINQDLKNKILNSIINEWVSVIKASKEYWVSTITIYKWLKKTQSEDPWKINSLQEIKRLKKDKEDLLLIIWEMQAELSRIKKKK